MKAATVWVGGVIAAEDGEKIQAMAKDVGLPVAGMVHGLIRLGLAGLPTARQVAIAHLGHNDVEMAVAAFVEQMAAIRAQEPKE